MQKILEQLQDQGRMDYERLGEFLEGIDFSIVDYKDLVPAISSSNNYSRNILTLEPIEVIILNWPPSVESAVHHHNGFWGYVAVLEGTCENAEYLHKEGVVSEDRVLQGTKGGLMAEPDGTLHKISNPSTEENLITAHFYYPAQENMENMAIYDLENERIGILNDKAASASWNEPKEHFKGITEEAFRYVPNPAKKMISQNFPDIT